MREGKTDILIRAEERNAFIAECKVWKGEKAFKEGANDSAKGTVDQLLSYLGWRDTKCAILLFGRQRSVTEIFKKADAAVTQHECFKRIGTGSDRDLERRYVLHWPGDKDRELKLTLQVFSVPDAETPRSRRSKA